MEKYLKVNYCNNTLQIKWNQVLQENKLIQYLNSWMLMEVNI